MAKFSTLSSGVSRCTSSQLTSNSSAMTWASTVPMCWPISHLTICIATLASGVSVNQIEGVKLDMPSAFAALLPRAGSPMLMKVPAAVAAERTKNSRLLVFACASLSMTASIIHELGGALHSADDPGIGGATTHVACHAIHDLLLSRTGIRCKQGSGLHDLAGLAIAALRHLMLDPSLLHGGGAAGIEALDGGDELSFNGSDRDRAGAHGLAVDVNCARPAQANSATVFGAGKPQILPDDPQEWSVLRRVGKVALTIDRQVGHGSFPPSSRMGRTPVAAA